MFPTSDLGSPGFLAGLLPGDVFLFSRKSTFNLIISIKTWSRFTHVEVVCATATEPHVGTAAARNGVGVGLYPLDLHGLALVLRPQSIVGTWDQAKAMQWYQGNHIGGQAYDWIGLLNFTYARLASENNHAQFCSEFATRFLRAGGVDPFPEADADTISPRDFSITPALRVIWRSPDEWARYDAEREQAKA